MRCNSCGGTVFDRDERCVVCGYNMDPTKPRQDSLPKVDPFEMAKAWRKKQREQEGIVIPKLSDCLWCSQHSLAYDSKAETFTCLNNQCARFNRQVPFNAKEFSIIVDRLKAMRTGAAIEESRHSKVVREKEKTDGVLPRDSADSSLDPLAGKYAERRAKSTRPMNDIVRQKLKELVRDHGKPFYVDGRLCRSLLADTCAGHKKETEALVVAVEEGVTSRLVESVSATSVQLVITKFVRHLEAERSLTTEAAAWVVCSWAWAMDIIDEITFNKLISAASP